MGKDKKKTLGIKTTRYFTKNCTNCQFVYPNWFTNCPKCGATWDSTKAAESVGHTEILKKTIKIVVKITEEDFSNTLERVLLIFSADHGKSWYRLRMEQELDYFIAEINDVPMGSIIIYYIEVLLAHGETVIENNEGKYFHYEVGIPIEESKVNQQIPQGAAVSSEYNEMSEVPDTIDQERNLRIQEKLQEPIDTSNSREIQPPHQPKSYSAEDNVTIFGKLQTQIDPDLKTCPYCNSKIKKIWSTCPICGKNL